MNSKITKISNLVWSVAKSMENEMERFVNWSRKLMQNLIVSHKEKTMKFISELQGIIL